MEKLGFVGSMSGKGSCFDNAAMESFFSSYKRECVHKQTYESLEVAQKETFNYIESGLSHFEICGNLSINN